ncbi:MAG: PDZ domain-containing protein [Phycisphaerae bacterium]|nr:PDZ domain-containing protein [Phycisphaerae bacterium]
MIGFLLAVMSMLPAENVTVTMQTDDDEAVEVRTMVICTGDDDEAQVMVQALPPGGGTFITSGGPKTIRVRVNEEGFPKIWIGVRITDVPAPLAAHIGEGGVMIANVVADSPADRAGLERYDVAVSYDGRDVDSPKDLTAAIAETEVGQVAKITIIRQAQREDLRIKPVERPAHVDWEWKYDEPEDTFLKDAMKFRGKTLRLGPHREWILEELGPMPGFPDALEELKRFHIDLELDELMEPHFIQPHMDLDFHFPRDLDDLGSLDLWFGDDDDEMNMMVTVKVQEDGLCTTVQRDADGSIHVTRVDEEGNETSATYDSPEALEEEDPEAYQLLPPHSSGHKGVFIHRHPSGKRARELRQEFQIDVRKKVEEALEQAKEARQEAESKYKEALEKARKATGETKIEILKEVTEGQPAPDGEHIQGVRVEDSGMIKVFIFENGETVTYTFTSEEAFKAAEPELYEEVQDLLE